MSYPHTRVKPHVQIPKKADHFQAFCGPWSGTGAPTTGVTGTYGPVQLVRVMFSAVLDARRRAELRRGSFGAPERSEAELRCFDMYHMRRIEDRSFFCLGSCIWVVFGVCKALVMAGHSKTNYFFGQTGSRLSAVPACRSTTLLHHGCCGLVRTPSETIVQVTSLRGVAECNGAAVVSAL